MLNSAEHKILTAHKNSRPTIKKFLALSLSGVVFIMLINVKMPTVPDLDPYRMTLNINFINKINCLDPDQKRRNVMSDLGPNGLILMVIYSFLYSLDPDQALWSGSKLCVTWHKLC